MANIVKKKIILGGPTGVVVAYYFKSDGSTGELTNYNILVPTTDLNLPAKSRLTLDELIYNFAGFDACISFGSGAIDPTFKWVLSEGTNHPINFRPYGALIDDSGIDGTGALQITTTGFTSSVDQGSLLIKLRTL